MPIDFTKLSDDDLDAYSKGNLQGVSDEGLDLIQNQLTKAAAEDQERAKKDAVQPEGTFEPVMELIGKARGKNLGDATNNVLLPAAAAVTGAYEAPGIVSSLKNFMTKTPNGNAVETYVSQGAPKVAEEATSVLARIKDSPLLRRAAKIAEGMAAAGYVKHLMSGKSRE